MFSGLTATDPAGLTIFADDVATEILTYLRDPGLIEPLLADAQELAGRRSSIRYFFDAFRLRAPSLALDVEASPLVAAPAHQLPIDYFSGPTRVTGTMNGRAVAGFGFHERTLPLSLPRQLVIVLRDSVLYLPAAAVRDSPLAPQQLADLVWEMMRFLRDRRYLAARSYIDETCVPPRRRSPTAIARICADRRRSRQPDVALCLSRIDESGRLQVRMGSAVGDWFGAAPRRCSTVSFAVAQSS